MIVKNEYVKIKSGKEYTLKNYIYDDYLKLFSDYQKSTYSMIGITETNNTCLSYCCIKVDTELEDYTNASSTDFDIFIPLKNYQFTGDENGTSTIYEYSSLLIDYANPLDLTPYEGKKITAIGFCGITQYVDVTPVKKLYACIDTSYYSIYINAEQGLEISRKDTIQSNAVCDGYAFPLHLATILERKSEPDEDYQGATGRIRAVLYSVGFGTIRGRISQEWIIGEDATINTIDNYTYGISMKNPMYKAIYPRHNEYPSTTKYPIQPDYQRTIYPAENIYPSNNRYPTKTGYNYIIFKYRLYYNILNNIIFIDEYYTMSYAYNPKGIFIATNKIERG